MNIEQYISPEAEKMISGGTLLKNLLSDCKEKHTSSAIYNIQYSNGKCTFELIEYDFLLIENLDDGYYVPCASFTIECDGVTQIKQDITGDLDYYHHADIKFSVRKSHDKSFISFSYIHLWTQTDLFFVEAEKMELIKYEKQR